MGLQIHIYQINYCNKSTAFLILQDYIFVLPKNIGNKT